MDRWLGSVDKSQGGWKGCILENTTQSHRHGSCLTAVETAVGATRTWLSTSHAGSMLSKGVTEEVLRGRHPGKNLEDCKCSPERPKKQSDAQAKSINTQRARSKIPPAQHQASAMALHLTSAIGVEGVHRKLCGLHNLAAGPRTEKIFWKTRSKTSVKPAPCWRWSAGRGKVHSRARRSQRPYRRGCCVRSDTGRASYHYIGIENTWQAS